MKLGVVEEEEEEKHRDLVMVVGCHPSWPS